MVINGRLTRPGRKVRYAPRAKVVLRPMPLILGRRRCPTCGWFVCVGEMRCEAHNGKFA